MEGSFDDVVENVFFLCRRTDVFNYYYYRLKQPSSINTFLGLLVIPIPKPPGGPGIFDSEKTHDRVWLKTFSACDIERKKKERKI